MHQAENVTLFSIKEGYRRTGGVSTQGLAHGGKYAKAVP